MTEWAWLVPIVLALCLTANVFSASLIGCCSVSSSVEHAKLPGTGIKTYGRGSTDAPSSVDYFHVPSVLPARPASTNSFAVAGALGTSPEWDEQIGITFTQSFVSLAYNVTAVAQTDQNGYGPAYLLNGLTNTGYWYQVGLSYNWPYVGGGYFGGFAMNYQVFAPNKQVVYPSNGEGGLTTLSGQVNPGDKVLLSLSIRGGSVIMQVYDWNTSATATESYSSESSTSFQGDSSGSPSTNGFFTGLMTEQYHVNEYFGGEEQVLYTETGFTQSSAWMWIDEWNTNTSQVAFSTSSSAPVYFTNPKQLVKFEAEGAVEYADGYEFITGQSQLVLSTTLKPVFADVGTAITLDFNATVSGGSPPYFLYLLLDDNLVNNFTTVSGTVSIVDGLGRLPQGNHTLSLEAFDSKGKVAGISTTSLTVNTDPTISIGTNYPMIDLGQTIEISVQPAGGTPPYGLNLLLNGAPEGNVSSVRPAKLGMNEVVVNLTDGTGFSVLSNTITVQVNPDPSVTVNATAPVTDNGMQVRFTETSFNGTPPYSVLWLVNGSEVFSSMNSEENNFTPSSTGLYYIQAVTTDSVGYTVYSTPFALKVDPLPRIGAFSATGYSTNFFFVNNVVQANVSVFGGTPPFTYSWMLNGVPVAVNSQPNFVYDLGQFGLNQASVAVRDSAGGMVDSKQIPVSYGFDFLHLAIVSGLTVLGVVLLVVFVARARSSSRTRAL